MTPEVWTKIIADCGQVAGVLIVVFWFKQILSNHLVHNTEALRELTEAVARLNGRRT